MNDFNVGDTIKVHYKIIEAGKARVQPYDGIVLSKRGSGESKTFIVRHIGPDSVGVERICQLNSPNIDKIDILKEGKVKRAKLFYLRGRIGKAATKVPSK